MNTFSLNQLNMSKSNKNPKPHVTKVATPPKGVVKGGQIPRSTKPTGPPPKK